MNIVAWVVVLYWFGLALAVAFAGAMLLWQALRPQPFGQPGIGVHQPHGLLVGGVPFMHRWSVGDRIVLAGWAFVLLTLARLALQALVDAYPL